VKTIAEISFLFPCPVIRVRELESKGMFIFKPRMLTTDGTQEDEESVQCCDLVHLFAAFYSGPFKILYIRLGSMRSSLPILMHVGSIATPILLS